MQEQLASEMQQMQDMFLSKFKKLKQKNKVLFNKAMRNQDQAAGSSPENNESGGEKSSIKATSSIKQSKDLIVESVYESDQPTVNLNIERSNGKEVNFLDT